ncbi:MAG: hypothetical protein WB566_07535 [Terriglobales bacterium]
MTLDCPGDCPYLLQARQQALEHGSGQSRGRPGAGNGEAWSAAVEIPEVEITEQFLYEREELILGLSFALAKSARTDRSLMDRDLIAALSSLVKHYQVLVTSSLIYDPPTANIAHQSIGREVETMVREFRAAEEKQLGYNRLRDSDVLTALVFLLRMGLARTSGRPKSRAYVDFLFEQFPEKRSVIAGADESGNRIVIP